MPACSWDAVQRQCHRPRARRVRFVAINVPEPASGQGYHLWLFRDGEAEYAGLLEPDTDGDVLASLDADLADYDAMEVDLQPLAAKAPGGTTVLEGALN